ncbi:NPCBM/NEW2 domain-containing protein [Lentzea fradiae]|uniref:NPCBM/NEW2 domain-containing protein n=1 Tax=Lentzea fradiae TaxID=200378 RepID=UPI0015A09957|nr:NPCBM/NEW2 domain-containing protein [Lentzea fradiae]
MLGTGAVAAGVFVGVVKYKDAAVGSPALETSVPTSTVQPAAVTTGPLRSGEGWYDLSLHEPLEIGQGQELVASIVIGVGGQPFENSIRGYLVSSMAQQTNASTWTTDSRCTRLSVWVGKDAASSLTGGTGEFVVEADGEVITSREATSGDAPQHLEVDVSTVDRLRLVDVRGSHDADNAWGTPRVYCTAPPGKLRS